MAERLIAGVDEAGRGPLAGPVCVAAVILPSSHGIVGLADSKKLTAKRRERLAIQIRAEALAYTVIFVSAQEIDRLNILAATLQGMQQAVQALSPAPELVLVDGNQLPALDYPARSIVGGDASEACISAASILAKTERDALLDDMHERYPEYGFNRHKGYPTRDHLAALQQYGPTPEHRRSYAPVARLLAHREEG